MPTKEILFVLSSVVLFAQSPFPLSFGLAPAAQPAGLNANGVVSGDFNGDGKPDLLVFNGSAVTVFLGNGDGTFSAPINSTITTTIPSTVEGVAVGDLNGDKKLDLVTSNLAPSGQSSLVIMLGNGDGTFQQGASYPFSQSSTIGGPPVLADFNDDGRLDLAVSETELNKVDVWLGNGDGTFGSMISYPAVGVDLTGPVVAGDFNGDGRVDLISMTGSGGLAYTFSLWLGVGDGTFEFLRLSSSSMADHTWWECMRTALILDRRACFPASRRRSGRAKRLCCTRTDSGRRQCQ